MNVKFPLKGEEVILSFEMGPCVHMGGCLGFEQALGEA